MPAAEFAASLGLRVAVVERSRVGGDCLWTGCVPSKALIASAKVAHHLRTAERYGLPSIEVPPIDTGAVWARIKSIQQSIASTDDDPARYDDLGVKIVMGDATLVDGTTVAVGERLLSTKYVLLCTGSRPAEVPIPGLAEVGHLTSEVLFELDRLPDSITFIGGGPISLELAQSLHRLGLRVAVLDRGARILPRDEPALAERLQEILRAEGLDLRHGVTVDRVTVESGQKVVHATGADGVAFEVAAAEIFVGAGRAPNVEGLGLEALGIETTAKGITTDDRGRTAVKTVYAAGDVAGRFLFTHAAAYEAVRAVRDIFFPGKGTWNATIPWCTFTDPELAHVGLTEAEAREQHGDDVHVWSMELGHNDRARADGTDEGLIRIITGPKGKVLGGHILAVGAGELIHELAVAEKQGMSISELAGVVHVYPTVGTSVAMLASESLFDSAVRIRRLTRFLTP